MTAITTKLSIGNYWSSCLILNPEADIDWVGETANPDDAKRLVACWNALVNVSLEDIQDVRVIPSHLFSELKAVSRQLAYTGTSLNANQQRDLAKIMQDVLREVERS